ncbi:MAG TPA: OmpA family protein [Polyangiaceae bacterium]|nr:OmpA family protein [Polyangiaceae bacterium]
MSRWLSRLVGSCALTLAFPVGAQGLDPPPGAAVDPPPGAASDAPPPAAEPASPGAPLGEPPEWAETDAAQLPDEEGEEGSVQSPADSSEKPQRSPDERERSLSLTSGLLGATGLMRVLSADSGAPGTFRFSLLTGFYSGSGFLCPSCPNNGNGATLSDDISRVSADLFLSASLTDFLEAYAGVFSHSTSTNRPVDQLKQVVGDWDLGVKVFTPTERGQIFSAGGALDLGFSTGSGQVGISGIDSINMGIRALGTADFSRRAQDPIPLRAHVNFAYYFDNSGNLVKDFESQQQRTVDRIERFALDINRVDFLQFGLGAEGTFSTARPFLEWSIDIPANRQGYTCQRETNLVGDSCLRDRATFSTTPSRLSAGLHLMPWQAASWWPEGLGLTGAMDLATGAASDFLVELAPEVPWTVWFGLSYAGDTHPKVEIQQIAAPAAAAPAAPDLSVHGLVIEKDTNTAIADALIHFDGRDLTGLITTSEGRFVTGPLEPGRYTFRISAPGYKEGICSVDVSESGSPVSPAAPGAPPSGAAPGPAAFAPEAVSPASGRGLASSPAAAATDPLPGVTPLTCQLEPTPKVSNINGRVTDNVSGEAVGGASVRITDVLGRELELQVDEVGAFRFENVPPGATTITIQAPGYLKSVTKLGVEPLQELDQRFVLAPVPNKPGVRIGKQQLDLVAPITFAEGSAKLSREALITVQELAPFIEAHPEIGRIEVQSHTADAGPSGMTLSTERANAVRDALVLHGVAPARLTARGYGGGEPLVPADSEAARRKNERITLKLEGGGAAKPLDPAKSLDPGKGLEAPKPATLPKLEPPKL